MGRFAQTLYGPRETEKRHEMCPAAFPANWCVGRFRGRIVTLPLPDPPRNDARRDEIRNSLLRSSLAIPSPARSIFGFYGFRNLSVLVNSRALSQVTQ
jgi:hypothetical protein